MGKEGELHPAATERGLWLLRAAAVHYTPTRGRNSIFGESQHAEHLVYLPDADRYF